jgi:hypothetical protein
MDASRGARSTATSPDEALTPRGRATLALGLGTYLGAWAFGAQAL